MRKHLLPALMVIFGVALANIAVADNVPFPMPPKLTDTSTLSLTDNVPFPMPPK